MNIETKIKSNLAHLLAEKQTVEMPDVWLEKNFIFDEEEIKGPWTFDGRNYLRKLVNDNALVEVREQTAVTGTGCGKSISYIGGICWKIKFKPCRSLWVMPASKGEGGSSNFAGTRFLPDIEKTECLNAMVPSDGQKRFKLNKQFIRLNGAHIGFVGSNSPSQIASNRCSDIRMDETDKFKGKLGNEAGTNALVRNRVKGIVDFQIFDTSTPTVADGIIWPRLLRSNLHFYFVPCPHCNAGKHGTTESEREIELKAKKCKGWMVYAWSEQFSQGLPRDIKTRDFKASIPFGYVFWDKDSKGKDGIWNYEAVKETAHILCPHCQGKIFDSKKVGKKFYPDPAVKQWMDENGVWIKVKDGVPGHVGYHASSLYAPVINDESTWGGAAVQFLASAESGGEDMRDFINSVLALPEIGQQFIDATRIELGKGINQNNSILRWLELSGDRQAKYPGFWYVVRSWVIQTLAPIMEREKYQAWLKALPVEDRNICDRFSNKLVLEQIQRSEHWQPVCKFLNFENLSGGGFNEFFQKQFSKPFSSTDEDVIRLLRYVAGKMKFKIVNNGDSEAVEIGSADSWEEIAEAQSRHQIANCDVMMDARFGSLDNSEVFAECFRRCPKEGFVFYSAVQTAMGMGNRFSQVPFPGGKPFALHGWTPCMGFPESKTWLDLKSKVRLPYGLAINDPFAGKAEARQYFQYVFQFDANWSLSELRRVREKYTWSLHPNCKFFGNNAQMNPVTIEDYNRHMKGYYWDDKEQCWQSPSKKGGSQARLNPNHLYDCEKNGLARAVWKGVFKYEREK